MAEKSDIIDAIEALTAHCRPPIMDIEQRGRWLRDWASDLAEYPLDAIQSACRKWRHSGSLKFPTPGQLLPLIREGLPKSGEVRVWREATSEEFAAMSVRDKIRELTILAHEARTKAGPMFRNTSKGGRISGKHLTAEEMPDTWRRWTAEAERLEGEIKRLRGIVRTPYQQAAE